MKKLFITIACAVGVLFSSHQTEAAPAAKLSSVDIIAYSTYCELAFLNSPWNQFENYTDSEWILSNGMAYVYVYVSGTTGTLDRVLLRGRDNYPYEVIETIPVQNSWGETVGFEYIIGIQSGYIQAGTNSFQIDFVDRTVYPNVKRWDLKNLRFKFAD